MMKIILSISLFALSLLVFGQDKVELVIPTGHTGQIKKMVLSEDTTTLVSIQNTEEIIVWDQVSRKKERVLRYHEGRVNDIAIIGGNLLASAGDDQQVIIWDIVGKRPVAQTTLGEPVLSIHESSDSGLLIVGEEGKVLSWDYKTNQPLDSIDLDQKVYAASLDSGTGRLALASKDSVFLFDNQLKPALSMATNGDRINVILLKKDAIYLGNSKGELVVLDSDLEEKHRVKAFSFRLYHIALIDESNQLLLTGRDELNHLKEFDMATQGLKIPNYDLGIASRLSEGGIRTVSFTPFGEILIPDYDYGIRKFELANQKRLATFQGLSFPINDIDVANNGKYLAIASSTEAFAIHDLSGVIAPIIISGHKGGVSSVAFHPTDSLIASVGFDNKLKVWSVTSGALKYSFDVRGRYVTTPIKFNVSGQYLIQKTGSEYFELFDLDKSKSKKLKIKDGIDYKFAQNGQILVFQTREGYLIYDAITLKELSQFNMPKTNGFDIKGETISVLTDDEIVYFDLDFNEKSRVKTPVKYDNIYLHPNEKTTLSTINSAQSGSSYRDYSIKYLHSPTDEIVSLKGHHGFISNIKFIGNGEFILSSSKDGQITIRSLGDVDQSLATLTPLAKGEWVVTTPSGVFDASQSSYRAMHYVRGIEEFDLSQLKDLYYEPKLLPRVLGFKNDPIQDRKPLSDLAPAPEISIKHPHKNNGILGLNVKNTGGGVSYVVIKINGKEVLRELRTENAGADGSVNFDYTITGHPFLRDNTFNKVSVKAYNDDGSLSSPEEKLRVFGNTVLGQEATKPKLYALVVGTDNYPGDNMDLTYAGKDAMDFAEALSLVGENYYGKENASIQQLNTRHEDQSTWPTKENIQRELKKIQTQATAQDVLVIYLSGHGMNYGKEQEDFYYLTANATDNFSDDNMRESATVSSRELTEWVKEIAALQQVLIVDACHSGKLTSAMQEVATMGSGQIKALEQMKDRSGLYILAGSESDAVSYESSVFEQGLLTYSILFGMKGATNDQKGDIDIIDLFQFVSKKVPELANEIGQVQMPEMKIPSEAETFALGSMGAEDHEKIKIIESKPVFIQSGFQEISGFNDPIHLGAKVDKLLLEESAKSDRTLFFLDKKLYYSGYTIKGRYEVRDNEVVADIKVFKSDQLVNSFRKKAVNGAILSKAIVSRVLQEL